MIRISESYCCRRRCVLEVISSPTEFNSEHCLDGRLLPTVACR